MVRSSWSSAVIYATCLISLQPSSFAQTVMPVVEGFEGESVTLPCTVEQQGMLRWSSDGKFIATKSLGGGFPFGGSPLTIQSGPYRSVVNITGEFNLTISVLNADRDNNKNFTCYDSVGGESQVTTVRVLARITGVSILDVKDGMLTVRAGEPKTLTCEVTGNPRPDPSYMWTVDDRTAIGQGSNFSLIADKSTKTVKCTVTNTYSNGSVLSTAETTATLNVLSMDPTYHTMIPVVEGFEGESVTLPCTVEQQGMLRWSSDGKFIATKSLGGGFPFGGSPLTIQNGPYRRVVNITGEFNLTINALNADRDNNKNFTCYDSVGGESQVTTVRVLAKITGVSILDVKDGMLTVRAGEPKTLTCEVTGNPRPDPSYMWTVDDRTEIGHGSNFSLTADNSTKTVKCTATNTYINGSILSTAEAMATLKVSFSDEEANVGAIAGGTLRSVVGVVVLVITVGIF